MSVELYPPTAPNAVFFLISWLLPLPGNTWPKRPIDTTFPYRIVRLASGEGDLFTAESVVSVHSCAATFEDASDAAWKADARINMLINDPSIDVQMPDGRIANAAYVETFQVPTHVDYGDSATERFVARYQLSFDFS